MLRALLCALLLTGFSSGSNAEDAPISLYCARGNPDAADANITLNPHGSHAVQVVFVGLRPSAGRADWSLRDCLDTASRLDGSRDIVASLWYRDAERGSPRERLRPAGVYRAASRSIRTTP